MTTLTENVQPTYVLVANAGRLALSMGLHQIREEHTLPDDKEQERQRNIFWTIYILEKDICFRCDRPAMINDDDIAISFPLIPVSVEATTNTMEGLVLRALSELAYLESRIYSRLISAKGRIQSITERQRHTDTLNNRLQSWRVTLPVSIRPEEESSNSQRLSINASILNFAYQNCRIVLNQSSLWTDGKDDIETDPRALLRPSDICVSSARKLLQALRGILYDVDRPLGLLW